MREPLLGSILLLAAVAYGPALAGKKFVATPDVSWTEILPYVRSHVFPSLAGEEFHVYVCSEKVLRAVVEPYEETLGDFAKVLVFEGMRADRRIADALRDATESFRSGVPNLTEDERTRYREIFWERLAARDDYLPRLLGLFEKSRTRGKLRCSICEMDPAFNPAGLIP